MELRRLALVVVAVGCGGALKEPDGGPGSGELTGVGGSSGGAGGAHSTDGGPGQIVDVRPPDEPCSPEVTPLAVADETCRFWLAPPPCIRADTSHIDVKVGGVAIPYDPSGQDGWAYDDPDRTMVRINGPSCDAVTRGDGVTIVYKIILP